MANIPEISSKISATQGLSSPFSLNETSSNEDTDFGKMLIGALQTANQADQKATQLQNQMLEGKQVEYHDIMIAKEQASIALNLTTRLTNKAIEGWHEINRMQV